jgi:F0F1-type ATP synthase membrane subunit c/vacuolar-type H+-ATPase subunit K
VSAIECAAADHAAPAAALAVAGVCSAIAIGIIAAAQPRSGTRASVSQSRAETRWRGKRSMGKG